MITSLIWILTAMLVYGMVHSWLASLGLKQQVHGRFGAKAMRGFRLFYNLFALISFLPVLALVALLPDGELYALRAPWLFIFLLVQATALILLLVGLLQTDIWSFLGLRQAFSAQDDLPEVLVTSGLYRWVRHPLYTAGLVFIWFMPIMTFNVLALNLGLSGYILFGAWLEERKLLRQYGSAYQEFRERTPMLVPGLRWRRLRGEN